MEQFFVPHFKSVRGRLVPQGRRPVGPAAPDGNETLATLRLEKVADRESGRLMDVFITQTARPERHINICIIARPDGPRRSN